MGPAFDEALNHIRYTVDDDSDGEAASDSPGLGDPSESPITAAETTLLRKNAAAVYSLEVLFSQWYERCILLGCVLGVHSLSGTRIVEPPPAFSQRRKLSASGAPYTVL